MKRSLRSWIWRIPIDREVDEEIAFHVDMRTRELVQGGMDPQVARERALDRMGDLASIRRTCQDLGRKRDREMRLTQWLEEFRDDMVFAFRQLKAAPAFAVAAILTLALGIGVNSAIFALVDAILLRPLPFHDPDRIVVAWERSDTTARGRSAMLNIFDWDERSSTVDIMAGLVTGTGGAMVMAGANGLSETVPRQWVTAGFFDVLGVRAIVGRTFQPSDASPQPTAAVMSEGLWRTRFASDASVIGRQIRFDGIPYTVIGVVPKEFQFLGPRGIWALLPRANVPIWRRQRNLLAIGRLKEGVTIDAAGADLASIADGLAKEYPATNAGRSVGLEPVRSVVIGDELRLTAMLFLGVVGLVLLMCCGNVANLLLARTTARARELAVRSALGAGRRRIVRQLLTESLVLAALGGVVGMAIGAAILSAAPAMIPADLLPGELALVFDARVVAFCAVAAIAVGFLFGLAPAWQATGGSTAAVLAAGGRGTTGRGIAIRRLLVVSQVATAVVLLFGGGLLVRTMMALERIDRGYGADSVLTMMVDPLGSTYPTLATLTQFFQSVEREVRALPGVEEVAWSSSLPMSPAAIGAATFQVVGDAPVPDSQRPVVEPNLVTTAYFRTLDVPLLSGRQFTELDTASSVGVCIVDEAFVRRLGGRSPVGMHIEFRALAFADAPPVVRQIVGVARQVRRPDGSDDMIQVYLPFAQASSDDMYLLVRAADGRAAALTPSVRAAIARVDRQQLVSVHLIKTLEDAAREHAARHRFRARLMMAFAGLALMLAMVGVLGVLSYTVQQRVREFGVRMALGATTQSVVRLVFSSAARVVGAGAIVGLVVAAIFSRLMTSVLFGVEPLDAVTFAAVTAVIVATAVAAAAAPAWRASRTDPAVALRGE